MSLAPRATIMASCLFLGVSLGLCLQVLRITATPQEFRSLARLSMLAPDDLPQEIRRPDQTEEDISKNFHAIKQALESPILQRRTLERVRLLHPELKDRTVHIQVAQAKATRVLNVLSTSTDPRYSKIFLDVLLEEFLAFTTHTRPHPTDAVLAQIFSSFGLADPKAAVRERATTAAENIVEWEIPLFVGLIGGGVLGAATGSFARGRILPPPTLAQSPSSASL